MIERLSGEEACQRPATSEFEFTLVGGGYGEAVAIHLPSNHWMIIDSCVAYDDPEGDPPVLSYLREIGVETSASVDWVIASHWHDDHVAGISRLLKACTNARFALPSAFQSDEALILMNVSLESSRSYNRQNSGLVQLSSCMDALRGRPAIGDLRVPHYAIADRQLRVSATPSARVLALAPSDRANQVLLEQLGAAFATVYSGNNIPRPKRNHTSIVLWIEVDGIRVLLGSDLEHTPDGGMGWRHAVATAQAAGCSAASLYKVAHHGSPNAEYEALWSDLLDTDPVLCAAPWHVSSRHLPRRSDVDRLMGRSDYLFLTARPIDDPVLPQEITPQLLRRPRRDMIGRVTLRRKVGLDASWRWHCVAPAHRVLPHLPTRR